MGKPILIACACVLLTSCAGNPYEGDPDATKAAEDQYSICLAETAVRLDDGRSEAAAIGNSVAAACYPQFVQIQIADGDAAREEFQSAHSPGGADLMHKQDVAQQNWLATQAVTTHRHSTAELAANAANSEAAKTNSAAN